ncbi:CKK domain-containing protein [Blastocladiella britannica]|nr:CKK domain-containing protein [Blastocladiella britannica]
MLLAGGANVPARTEVLEDLERSGGENFVILLRGAKNHSFKGLYTHLVETGQIVKLYGSGPIEVSDQDITDHFKYDSGSRSFKSLSTRSMSTLVHGMVLNTNVLPSSATTVRAVDRR